MYPFISLELSPLFADSTNSFSGPWHIAVIAHSSTHWLLAFTPQRYTRTLTLTPAASSTLLKLDTTSGSYRSDTRSVSPLLCHLFSPHRITSYLSQISSET